MAKTHPKSTPLRSRPAPPAKSAKAPARPAARTPAAKLPLRAKPAPPKAPAAKTPAKKAPPAKPAPPRARPAAVEKSPATEEEIISAVAGKISTRTSGGMTWLSAKAARIESIEISTTAPAPEPVIPVEAIVIAEEPAPAEPPPPPPAEQAETPAPASQAETPDPVPTAPSDNIPAETAPAEPPVSVVTEAVTEAVADTTAPAADAAPAPALPKPPPAALPWLPALATAMRQLSGALAVQGLTFIAFCTLVSGGVPTAGLPQVLAAAIPLFAILLAVAGYLSFHGTRRLLDQLEHDRAQQDPAHPPAPLTTARLFAHQPALFLLGFLILVWFIIGATVWWL